MRTRISYLFIYLFVFFRGRLPNLNRNRHDGWAGLLQRVYPIAGRLSTSIQSVGWRESQTGGVEVGSVIQGGGSGGYLVRGQHV